MKWFNAQRFWRVFAVLTILQACFYLTGCTAAWLTAVSGLLPGIESVAAAIVAFVVALEGKTVSASTTALLQKWQQNIASEIANVQSILAAIKASASTTLIGQFQAAMQAILQSFNSILSGLDITDSSTVAKLTQFVGLGVAAISAVLALIPLALSKLQAKAPKAELEQYDNLAASQTKQALKTMQETYVAIVSEHTPNADVNASLDALPRSI